MNLKAKRVFLVEKISKNNKPYQVLAIEFENGYVWESTALARTGGFMTPEMIYILKACA